jgi:3-hydroxyisobutyrate dehydrogenase
MAINLFTKTYQAHHDAASSSRTHRIDTARDTTDIPGFAICEQDDNRAEAFLRDLRNRGGSELANRVERVSDGSGCADI